MPHHDGAPVRLAVSTVIFALRPDHTGQPVGHPQASLIFDSFREGHYTLRHVIGH